ncbi:nuclear fragile X mental retardation-interacting protein 1-domain-containing protein [Scheffersomyces amazonensis]|uniref:nuclear fragile X mental retardation-interacting protein 1-domain-containing protein n=1 Tax=Scheffersomyces amazonensis TaxID=1078765 RepID=UPI00315D7F00
MDFVYAPPPPPSSSKKTGGSTNGIQHAQISASNEESSTNHKNNKNKNNNNNNNNNNNRRYNKHNAKQVYNQSSNNINQEIASSVTTSLLDLPTYLPNEEPVIDVSPSTKDRDEGPIKDKTDLDNNDEINNEVNDDEVSQTVKDPSQPIVIPGTNITLQTDEDIAKWIEERKKRWPTRKNIELKEQTQAQAQAQVQVQDQQNEINSQDRKRRNSNSNSDTPNTKKARNICRFYQLHKHCKFGNKCKNLHELPDSSISKSNKFDNPAFNLPDIESTHFKRTINDIPVLIPKLYSNIQKSGGRLFKHLIKREHSEHENNVILQFIQYLDTKGLIDHEVMKKQN